MIKTALDKSQIFSRFIFDLKDKLSSFSLTRPTKKWVVNTWCLELEWKQIIDASHE